MVHNSYGYITCLVVGVWLWIGRLGQSYPQTWTSFWSFTFLWERWGRWLLGWTYAKANPVALDYCLWIHAQPATNFVIIKVLTKPMVSYNYNKSKKW